MMNKQQKKSIARQLGRSPVGEDLQIVRWLMEQGMPLESITDFDVQCERIWVRTMMADLR